MTNFKGIMAWPADYLATGQAGTKALSNYKFHQILSAVNKNN